MRLRLRKIASGVFRGPRKVLTDRVFPQFFATLDYRRGGRSTIPLNGQSGRTAIMEAIIRRCGIERIVETGTYRGATTAWFAEFGKPVQTVEANRRFAHFVRLKFAGNPLVKTAEMDSSAFLKRLAHDPTITAKTTLFYLDAHWGRRLPLGEEIQTVAKHFPASVIVIDDFRVPDDEAYGFDDYGPGKRLDLDYVQRTGVGGLKIFFPKLRGAEETGARRGCVVLTASTEMAERLGRLPELRPYSP